MKRAPSEQERNFLNMMLRYERGAQRSLIHILSDEAAQRMREELERKIIRAEYAEEADKRVAGPIFEDVLKSDRALLRELNLCKRDMVERGYISEQGCFNEALANTAVVRSLKRTITRLRGRTDDPHFIVERTRIATSSPEGEAFLRDLTAAIRNQVDCCVEDPDVSSLQRHVREELEEIPNHLRRWKAY